MTLDADEFIRRFLLHVLPDGFHRIRHYGFLANGRRAAKLARIAAPRWTCPAGAASARRLPRALRSSPAALDLCPCCGGRMIEIAIISRADRLCRPTPRCDTS